MPNLSRGLAAAAGAVAETYGGIERDRIKMRHEKAMARVKDKYATAARKDTQKHELHRDDQKSKYRIAEYEMAQTDREGKEEREYTRGMAAKDKQYAHEIQKAKIAASGRVSGAGSARMNLTNSVWENLKAIRPDEDPAELWLEAFKLSNEKKELSPEAELRSVWQEVYQQATEGFDPMPNEEATEMADAAAESYKDKWFPDLAASRERFKRQKRNGKALGAQNGGNKEKVDKGKALGATAAPEAVQTRKDRLRKLY